MEWDKNYIGKVVRMQYTWQGQEQNKVGYVYDQKNVGNRVDFSVCLTNGQEWNPRFDRNYSDLKISSVRMDKDLRDALKVYGDARSAQIAFLQRMEAERLQHSQAIVAAQMLVKATTKEMSIGDMMQEVERLFQEAYPSSGGYYSCYFTCSSCSSKDVTMTQVKDVEKYANPEKYSFLYREYDDSMHVYYDSKEFKAFCEKNAPPVIPALMGYKSTVDGSVGDKNWLSACRSYTIPLKHGLTKDSLEDIKNVLTGKTLSKEPQKKPSLNSAIQAAASRSGNKTPDKKTQKKDFDR